MDIVELDNTRYWQSADIVHQFRSGIPKLENTDNSRLSIGSSAGVVHQFRSGIPKFSDLIFPSFQNTNQNAKQSVMSSFLRLTYPLKVAKRCHPAAARQSPIV